MPVFLSKRDAEAELRKVERALNRSPRAHEGDRLIRVRRRLLWTIQRENITHALIGDIMRERGQDDAAIEAEIERREAWLEANIQGGGVE